MSDNTPEQHTLDGAYAVILAGGYGERFWPMSTAKQPKQLLSLLGDRSMLGMAVDRLEGLIPAERVLVLTSADLVEPTIAAAPDLPPENIIGEPMRRDTAAAVALAAAVVSGRDPEGAFCILTADHVMGDLDRFRDTLRTGLMLASAEDVLVTIGITPRFPSTGFGYVEAGDLVSSPALADAEVVFRKVTRFVEKPDQATAEEYIASGRFSWNSGMFVWSAAALERAFAQHEPALAEFIAALRPAVGTDEFAAALEAGFEPLQKISIDYALMEKADNVVMAEGTFRWDDVGSWPAIADHLPADDDGNVVVGDAVSIDASNNVVFSDGRLTALIGVEDMIVVHTEGATLIVPKDRAQDVKKIVTELREDPSRADLL